jgi:ankyrin repeat protein
MKRDPELFGPVIRGSSVETRATLARYPDPDVRDRVKRTPLMYAVVHGHEDVAQLLLDAGADVNAQDRAGLSALHFAAQEYRAAIVRILLSRGARVDLVDKYGNAPLWTATFSSRGRGDVINLLLAAGGDPDGENKNGASPRKLAELIGNYDVKQFFRAK